MKTALRGLRWQTLLNYLNDIIVFSKDLPSHLQQLSEVFTRLKATGLKLKPKKCQLFAERVHYLGHVVTSKWVKTEPAKVSPVRIWLTPTHKTDIRALLRTCGYYRRFIARHSEIARPLTQL